MKYRIGFTDYFSLEQSEKLLHSLSYGFIFNAIETEKN